MTLGEMLQGRNEIQLVKMLLDEACGQWCASLEECPNQRNGEGFGKFFFDLYNEKQEEYRAHLSQVYSDVKNSLAYPGNDTGGKPDNEDLKRT